MLRAFGKVVTKQKLTFMAGLVLAVASLLSLGALSVKVSAADCDNNSIIYCGFSSPSNFISKVQANNSGNGHSDLQAVYAHQFVSGQSLPSSQYSNFAAHAVAGIAHKNNTITVNGQVVATNVSSIGRLASFQGSGYQTYTVGSTHYYGNVNAKAFASDNLPVSVLFDAQGNMTFAVMGSCGNPIFGTAVRSSASCKTLNVSAVSGKANSYNFSAAANVAGNAAITKYVYDFGDGSGTVTESNGNTVVNHTYSRAGSFTAKVTVYATFPGSSGAVPLTVITPCTHVITVVTPFYACTRLDGPTLDASKMKFSFVAHANFGNGAKFASADFDFGDGNKQTGVTNLAADNTVTVTHQYSQAKTYNITAILHFIVNGQTVSANGCTANVSPTTPPTPTCKPNVPVGSPECTPCQFDTSLPSDSSECVPPVLPNTGAGNVIAIFAAVVVAGFLAYRQIIFRRHKAAFMAAESGASPLPLGDPLNTEAPLAGTPLAPKRRSFRKRQY